MIRNILRTTGARMLAALLNLGVIVIAGQQLGAESMGKISLFILAVTLTNLVAGFAGGSALVYLMPRNTGKPLLKTANVWALLSSVITVAILYYIKAFPEELFIYVLIAGVIGSLVQNTLNVFLARENIKMHNLFSLLQAVFLFGGIAVTCFLLEIKEIEAYLYSVLLAYAVVLLFSWMVILKTEKGRNEKSTAAQSLKTLFGYGAWVQLAAVFALLTYRLTFYYTEAFLGLAALGVLAVGVQISEAVWILPKSIATVQYSKISNLKSREDAASLTAFLLLFILFFTGLAVAVLNVLPETLYTTIFGDEFIGVKAVIIALSLGIVLASMNNILSHFFSGTGRIIINLLSSLSGFLSVGAAGYILIKGADIQVAAWVSTLGYSVTFLFSLIAFYFMIKMKKISLKRGLKILLTR
jgi:O-antigen/teichoic acid export membrane protein